MVRAVVMDVGGVLEHTPPTGWVGKWEARLGLPEGRLAEVVRPIWRPGRVGTASLPDIEERTARALNLDPPASDELWTDVWAEYLGTLNGDLLDYVTGLPESLRTAILSNSFVGAREREQALYGFEDVFDHVIYSHEEGMEKPDPSFYLLACERLDVAPEDAVFVDDLPENTEAAREVGMRAVVFEDTEATIRALEHHLGRSAPGFTSRRRTAPGRRSARRGRPAGWGRSGAP